MSHKGAANVLTFLNFPINLVYTFDINSSYFGKYIILILQGKFTSSQNRSNLLIYLSLINSGCIEKFINESLFNSFK